jgi:DNA polymerase III subunit delta'
VTADQPAMAIWDRVVGQERAVMSLQRAAERPSHAYLLVGPRGSGAEEAARCFAAALVAADGDDRSVDLVLRGMHPDVIEIDPPANQIRIEDAQAIVDEVYRSPVEGARKVLLVFDAERLNDVAANRLLKTLEEPPPSACIVLVTAGADQLFATIRSRCQRIDFGSLDASTIARALEPTGASADRIALLARLAGGRLDRARALAGRVGIVRDAFVTAAASLDCLGGAVAEQCDRVEDAMEQALADLEAAQAAEVAELAAELERGGYDPRAASARRKRMEERQRREHRRARFVLIVEGITALESVYRDVLAGPNASPLNADRPRVDVDPRAAAHAIDACRDARQAFEFNPNEGLLLERLLFHLPAAR